MVGSGAARRWQILKLAFAAVAVTAAAVASSAVVQAVPARQPVLAKAVCPPVSLPAARCLSRVVTHSDGVTPRATTTYQSGYQPADLHAAYELPSLPAPGTTWPVGGTAGPTVAIVDAYDNPNAAGDLAAYRAQFGLPLCSDGTVTSCGLFTKVQPAGTGGNVGWGEEIDLDIEMVSAICPNCRIVLDEGKSNSLTDIGAAVTDAAHRAGVVAISNSYGTSGEFSGETSSTYAGPYNDPKIAVTASAGDSGYGVIFPAAANTVIAVGGTSLLEDSSSTSALRSSGGHTWAETVWNGTGSGCSAYFSRPSWQTPYIPAGSSCTQRVVGDVSAVADPNTGVAVYDSYGSTGGANWYVFGGTSVSSPIVASVYAIANNFGSVNYPASIAYSKASPSGGYSVLFDVTTGSNGQCSRGPKRSTNLANAFLCTAETAYDGPTGLGTPAGVSSAF